MTKTFSMKRTPKFVRIVLVSLLMSSPAARAEVTVVPEVDLDRYAGRWYEVASIPQFFQRKCVGDVSAEYTRLDDDSVKVVNQCRQADGSTKSAEGRARVVDAGTPAKLQVTFVKLFAWIYAFGGDYWIIDLAKDYRYAVIGHPKRKYAWILARTQTLPTEDLEVIKAHLVAQGYDLCQLLTTSQGAVTRPRRPLCEGAAKN